MTGDDDTELWRVSKGARTLVCRERQLRGGLDDKWNRHIAYELRIDHQGELYWSEVHADRVEFQRRVDELRAALLAEGWIEETKGEA